MTAALPAAPEGVLWAQTSTVSLHDAGSRLPALAGWHGARYIDAPVVGTRQPAEEGKLVVLAAAPEPLRDPVRPLFDALAARTVWVSERPGDGTGLKLVANSWTGTIVAATAQAIAFAQGLGLDPQLFLDTVKGGAVDTPFLHVKGQARPCQDWLVMKCLARLVPASFSPSSRETSSSVLRGRWFTTMCWVCPAALREITPMTPKGSPRI